MITQLINVTYTTATFSYAAVDRADNIYSNSQGQILWKGLVAATFTAIDNKVRTMQVNLCSPSGLNNLTFVGLGDGICIDNINLVKYGTTNNLVINSGFEEPVITN
jgi:hypothetical protein